MKSGTESKKLLETLGDGSGLEDVLRLVIESAPSGILVADESGRIVLVNERARELFGYSQEEFLGLNVDKLVPSPVRKKHGKLRSDFVKKPEKRAMGVGRDLHGVRKDGTEFPVEVGLTPMETSGGLLVVGTVVDITARKEAESQLKKQAALLANVHEAVFLVTPGGTIRSWNRGATEVYGFSEQEAVGSHVRIVLPEEDKQRFEKRTYPRVLEHGSYDFIVWSMRKNGQRIAVAVRASLLNDAQGNPEGVVICANDITEQKRLEQQIVEVSENEQRRIGQDIHDDLCQQLASIGCLTKVLEQRLEAIYGEGADALAQIGELVGQANTRAREIARGLVPAVLETRGLSGALQELAERTGKIYGIECRFHCPDPVEVEDRQMSVQLFRIAQEAVGNAAKHGKPGRIDIELIQKSPSLMLRITDDGQGMDDQSGDSGLGLMTMAHRAQMLGGELDIHTGAGQGTRIECSVFQADEEEQQSEESMAGI